jgi:NIMA (never in mitosis gene a)-related kinase 1/4/5
MSRRENIRIETSKSSSFQVKIGNLSDKEKHNALNEVRILASINDDFIIGYKEAFFDEASSSLCIIIEFANDGDLF